MKKLVILLPIIFVFVGCSVLGRSCSAAEDQVVISVKNATVSYDEYQNIYATCEQINADLGVIKETPEDDAQFNQFSKAQRINSLKQNLNRWINEYNAKSKHIDKKWWKSGELPQTLSASFFSNY